MQNMKAHNSNPDVAARFLDFCKGLPMDNETLQEATKLFSETKYLLHTSISAPCGNGTLEEVERYWFVFLLYCLKRLSMKCVEDANHWTDEKGFTLSELFRVAKLNMPDFFKEIPQFIVKSRSVLSRLYGADWEQRLEAKMMQANFVQLSDLSKYYKRVFHEFFSTNDPNSDKQSIANTSNIVSNYYRFGWLLFLALLVHAFSHLKDLVTYTNGLVSILTVLVIHVPVRFRKFVVTDSSCFVKTDDKGVDLPASLCSMYKTSEDELRKTLEKVNNVMAVIFKKEPQLTAEFKIENLDAINADGLIYFDDLLDESSLPSNIKILEKDYSDAIRNKGELDERIFVNEEDSLLVSINITGAKRKIDSISSPAKTIAGQLSPFRTPAESRLNSSPGGGIIRVIGTPVSTAMTTMRWLYNIISALPSCPSPELELFLSKCDKDVRHDMLHRAQIILEAIFPKNGQGESNLPECLQSKNMMVNIWEESRRLEAIKLYYRVLQAICTAEAQILQANNLTSLLSNDRFHRCMLACSAEIVLATHKTVTMSTQAILERTGITSFDLCKVIESFIRHEDSLPRELKRHLNSLEEHLLESMVWEEGSSMYNSLIVARPALSAEINRLVLLAEPMPSLDAIANISNCGLPSLPSLQNHEPYPGQIRDIRSPKRVYSERSVLVERNSFTSPVRDRLLPTHNIKSKFMPPALQSVFSSPTRPYPGGGGETCAETEINIFFGKIVKLAAVRISGLVERLQLSQQIRVDVYHLFQRVLVQWTSLFFNRHVDQIILCCLYGVAKACHLELTFKEILNNYKKQPHCKPQVFQNVFVDWSAVPHSGKTGRYHVGIITFYNDVFVPTVKTSLLELGSAKDAQNCKQVSEDTNHNDGTGSPKASSFPSLPDMSPRKVSSVHNVYVSPLRSSKRDALLSHSSKSYYACVGESTHAYQSPSKDLTTINSHLTGNRKVRGALKFDDVDVGLVSDTLVTKSLNFQNGSSGSSSTATVKTEQDDK